MSADQRQSYRFPVQNEFTAATIQSGRKQWKARLINESAGGFLFTVPAKASLKPGCRVTISIASGSYLAEVIHTQREGKELYVGLRRLDATSSPEVMAPVSRGGGNGGQVSSPRSLPGAFFFAVYVGLAVAAVYLLTEGRGEKYLARFLGHRGSNAYGPARPRLSPEVSAAIDPGTARAFRGITLLTSEKIRAEVNLSRAQEESLERIFDDTTRRLHDLYATKGNRAASEWSRDSAHIIDEAIQRVLCTLTDAQIESWRKELIEAAAAPPKTDQPAKPQ